MDKTSVLIVILIFAIILSLPTTIESRKRLKKYWVRKDYFSAKKWKSKFPNSSKDEIRKYLQVFVDGFAFNNKKKLKFEPEDKIIDIYNSLYPKGLLGRGADSLEFETFFLYLEEEYGLDASTFWCDDMTLGDVFENIIKIPTLRRPPLVK